MKLFGKRAARQNALAGVDAAIARVERRALVRTPQGRTAHYEHDGGALCGWPGASAEADPSLPLCKMCVTEDEIRGIVP